MESDTLESKSLWYQYKREVWAEITPEGAAIHNIMRTFRSVRNTGAFAYASSPITSGKFYYETLLRQPTLLKEHALESAMSHNYAVGHSFVEDIVKRRSCQVLFPADLIPAKQHWSQAHFQALWLSLIGEKCTEVHLTPDWEYSNGCVEEFTHVMQLRLGLPKGKGNILFFNTKEDEKTERIRMKGILVYDSNGKPITPGEARKKISLSESWVRNNGFNADRLKHCLELLDWNERMLKQGFYQ